MSHYCCKQCGARFDEDCGCRTIVTPHQTGTEPAFTPTYLRELRIQKANFLDLELVKKIEDEIRMNNGLGKTNCIFYIAKDRAWQKVIEHFENLGFVVTGWGVEYMDTVPMGNSFPMKKFKFDWNA